jgi:Tfp pilus assembly protein PilW
MTRLQKANSLSQNQTAHPERGASLVELLVAVAISILIFSVLSTALVQFLLTTRWGNNQLQVSNDIQIASLWLGRDALEAASFTPGTGAVYGTLNWDDSSHQFRYSYDSGNGALLRQHLEDGILQSTTTVARHISNQSDISFTYTGARLTVNITSTSGTETETASLVFALRTR